MRIRAHRKKSLLFILLGFLLAGSIFYYLFSRITWGQVVDVWQQMDRRLVCLFVIVMIGHQWVRTWRYRIILQAMNQQIGWIRLFLTVLVRGVCVDMLPARTGELVYIYILRTRLGVDLGAATTSFALVFLFDILALAPLLLLALFMVGIGTGGEVSLGMVVTFAAVLFVVSFALIFSLPQLLRIGFMLCRRCLPCGTRIRRFCCRLLVSMHCQVCQARRKGVYFPVFIQSLVVRFLKYAGYYVLLLSMVLPQGYQVVGWPFHKVFLGLVAAEMAASLPVSGVMGFGAYQGAWTLVFVLLGFPVTMAQVTSISHHLFTQVYGYVLGLCALMGLMLYKPR
ncbi:MAG: lysylphosphatidylglycerol synthase transmembrane domain-containing protein [Kiritimatiellia bacterium]